MAKLVTPDGNDHRCECSTCAERYKFVLLYWSTYAATQRRPSITEEATVMMAARRIIEKG
jgi:hypothetical protein